MSRKALIAVGIAAQPISSAGNTWAFLQWVIGFQDAGWDVHMVESIAANGCVDAARQPVSWQESANLAHWNAMVARFGLEGRATLLIDHDLDDPRAAGLLRFAEEAELFLNISGHFRWGPLPLPRAAKVYLDLDPGFTQIWAEAYGVDMNFAGHDAFFTVGTQFHSAQARVPTCGLRWRPIVPPVALRHWPFQPAGPFDRFTTVAHWHGYSWCEWDGAWFKGKGDEFIKFVDVPRLSGLSFELATEVAPNEGELAPFRAAGWALREASTVSHSMDALHRFITESSAEFSAVKGGYALSQAGWFSDRSVCYLATGRPVVLEDTGLGATVPVGEGLLLFQTPEEAAEACRRVAHDYERHQRAARALAETYFAGDRVVNQLIASLGC